MSAQLVVKCRELFAALENCIERNFADSDRQVVWTHMHSDCASQLRNQKAYWFRKRPRKGRHAPVSIGIGDANLELADKCSEVFLALDVCVKRNFSQRERQDAWMCLCDKVRKQLLLVSPPSVEASVSEDTNE